MDDHNRGPRPGWNRRNVAAESGVIHPLEGDMKDNDALFTQVNLELRMDHNNEGGSYDREGTGL